MLKSKQYARVPYNYDGTKNTSRKMVDLLPCALQSLTAMYQQRGDLILAIWPEVIGQRFAGMTEAISFKEGTLFVKVKNSTLHSLLNENEKFRILTLLRKKFPHVEIKNIIFRIG